MLGQFYVFCRKSQGMRLPVDNTTKMLYTDSVSVVGGFVSTTTPPLWASNSLEARCHYVVPHSYCANIKYR